MVIQMEYNQNNISTIISMIVPFLSFLIAKYCGFDVDQAMLTMFLTGVVELIVLIWSARNPNTLGIFGNKKPAVDEVGVLNDEYVSDGDDID